MATTFNISAACDLSDQILTTFNETTIYTKEKWEDILTALRNNWVGEDEQDFERVFADRINKLYANSKILAIDASSMVLSAARYMYDFQQSNKLSGSTITEAGYTEGYANSAKLGEQEEKLSSLRGQALNSEEALITVTQEKIDDTATRGLLYDDSATKIQYVITDFVENVKRNTGNLFDRVDSTQAFNLNGKRILEDHITTVSQAISEVTTAVKDLFERLEDLTNKNYSTNVENLESALGESNRMTTEALSEKIDSGTRWQ